MSPIFRPRIVSLSRGAAGLVHGERAALSNKPLMFKTACSRSSNSALLLTRPFHGTSEGRKLTREGPLINHDARILCSLPNWMPQCGAKSRASYSTEVSPADQPVIHDLFEGVTGTWQYIVADPASSHAVIIDPVLDYDPATQIISTRSADAIRSIVLSKGYIIDAILETHVHADHLTAASYLRSRLALRQEHTPIIGIGKRIGVVQTLFGQRYGIPPEEYEGVFDKLFDDDEAFDIGELKATAIHIPGHTPDHLGYKVGGKSPEISGSSELSITNDCQTMYSAATRYSTQTSVLRAVISLGEVPTVFSIRAVGF